jgi:hypothetical protein
MHLIRYPESFSANAAKFLGETENRPSQKITKDTKTDKPQINADWSGLVFSVAFSEHI